MSTLGQAWRSIQTKLEQAGIEPAPREGMGLVGHVLGLRTKDLLLGEGEPFPAEKQAELDALVARRIAGEPLAYVVGSVPFWSRDWRVTPDVLIPRPDTELLVKVALDVLPKDAPALIGEVGVGSGAVIGSVLLERPLVRGWGGDISEKALAVARENWRAAGVEGRMESEVSDLLDKAPDKFKCLISNPPYIAVDEYYSLEESVRAHEPELALVAGVDGLDIYRRLIPQAAVKLGSHGWLAMEIGWQQAEAVENLLPTTQWQNISTLPDLAGRPRVVRAQRR
jgi:release factor glutamine methyltransferase